MKLLATLPVGCWGGIGVGVKAVQVSVAWDTRFSLVCTPVVTVIFQNLICQGFVMGMIALGLVWFINREDMDLFQL